MKKVNIKGIDYEVIKKNETIIYNDESLADGVCEKYSKKITINNQAIDIKRVIRHELIHALLHECGMSKYESDEVLVDWFAFHIPEIEKLCKEIKRAEVDSEK